MFYVKTKREKIGKCNICLEEKELSWDHVPPKGGIELSTVQIETIEEFFLGKNNKNFQSQNGVKYRTICRKCNSLIGREYDIVLNKFSLDIGRLLKSKLIFPKTIRIKTKPIRLIKALFGHVLAAKIELDDVTLDKEIREIVKNINMPLTDNWKVFYWLYPYNDIVIMRDFSMIAKRGQHSGDAGIFNIIKYFPVAFAISNLEKYEGLEELTKYKNYSIDDEIEISINLKNYRHPYWPEAVEDDNPYILTGQTARNGISAKVKN
jgi:hypothetical protein